jgi:uncharacterized protein (TIGR03435 family)
MVWTRTKTAVTVGVAVVALSAAFPVWKTCFPPVNDLVFRMDYNGLERAPDNILILRPTHFADSLRHGNVYFARNFKMGEPVMRMMGRKVSFEQVIATAYSCASNRIILPLDEPKGAYDFLVTLPKKQNERLQAAIKKKLGFAASWEPRETEVLSLKIKTPNAPALRPSASGQRTRISIQNGKLQATHVSFVYLSNLLENALKQSVLDKTDQTNYYNFSVDFDWHGSGDAPDREAVDKVLNTIGLELQANTASIPMLVVKKAR